MYLKQILQFDSIKQLPKDFFCKACIDVCRQPIVQDNISFFFDNNCDDETKIIFNSLSSYLQFHIRYDCEYCGKNINYWNSKNHYMKCEDIVLNLGDMMEKFEIVSIKEFEKCQYCNQIPFKPKQYQGKIICLFCSNQNSLQKLEEISEELFNNYKNLQIKCIYCEDILNIQYAFIHFKKCLFNRKNYKIRKFENYYYVKQLRQQQKESYKIFNIDMRSYLIGILNEKKLNLEINNCQNEERRIIRKLNYLKQLKMQYEI